MKAFGSTPYVEKGLSEYCGHLASNQENNIHWTISTAMRYEKHLDFHIDYNLNSSQDVYIRVALQLLNNSGWPLSSSDFNPKTITFGHCTRITLFDLDEWFSLCKQVGNLPVSFIGLPTSDMFMMGREVNGFGVGERIRGTLQVSHMIKNFGLDGAISINNVGNAFTPHGSCDPLSLTSFCVGVYHAGTKADAEILYVRLSSLNVIQANNPPAMCIYQGKDCDWCKPLQVIQWFFRYRN